MAIDFTSVPETIDEVRELVDREIDRFKKDKISKGLNLENKRKVEACEVILWRLNFVIYALPYKKIEDFHKEIGISLSALNKARTDMVSLFKSAKIKNGKSSFGYILNFLLKTPYVNHLNGEERKTLRRVIWQSYNEAIIGDVIGETDAVREYAYNHTQHLWLDSAFSKKIPIMLEMLGVGATEDELSVLSSGSFDAIETLNDAINRKLVKKSENDVYRLISPDFKLDNEKRYLDEWTMDFTENHSTAHMRGISYAVQFNDMMSLSCEESHEMNIELNAVLEKWAKKSHSRVSDGVERRHVSACVMSDTIGEPFKKTKEMLDEAVKKKSTNRNARSLGGKAVMKKNKAS